MRKQKGCSYFVLSFKGYENEGWFDPWLLLKALRAKCHMLGVNYVVGEVVDFEASRYTHEITFPDMPARAPVIGHALREAVVRNFSFSLHLV